MRTPRSRGKPIDPSRKKFWLERFDGYRVAVTDNRIVSWLAHFQSADVDLGARVLDSVMFLDAENIELALQDSVSKLPGWHRKPSLRSGKWRFMAFSISAGESGDSMLQRSRTALGLTGVGFNELFIHKADLLREGLTTPDNVVLFDDFAGTGEQAFRAWRGDSAAEITGFAELLPGNPNTYLILVAAGQRAIERITQETAMRVSARHVLKRDDDIFSADCKHFNQAEKDRLESYCKRADRKRPRGYGACGFVIVLANKTPNNSIPVLHANHLRWKGLFPRH